VLEYIPTDTFILVTVYEQNGNALLEYKDKEKLTSQIESYQTNGKLAVKQTYQSKEKLAVKKKVTSQQKLSNQNESSHSKEKLAVKRKDSSQTGITSPTEIY
jgi:antitoxin component YwqK of YwqJK toxin-antitoxin module